MAPEGNRRATVAAAVTHGIAELRPDPARPRAWTLLLDGVPQSYVDLDDPTRLGFGYLISAAAVLRSMTSALVPLEVLHLGGGGLALPRFLDHIRPGSAQRVVERDGELVALIRRMLPPPAAVQIVVGDARRCLETEGAGRYDAIVVDVFEGASAPVSVGTTGFAEAARRALRPDGLLVMNVTDVPPLAHTRIQVATLAAIFADVRAMAEPQMLRGRRAGNIVLVAGAAVPDRIPALVPAAELRAFAAGAQARLDEPER
ncbi:fused MFS/spermidine synthase [Actinoplanes sp. NPDC051633]|uniref:spermidine synthase n=1 Tax=Actinoplanes sp. NPDC051633 TaxID=3155670 RepID=UPI00342E2B93